MFVGGGECCSKESKSWRAQKSISCNGVEKIERENMATFICVEHDTMFFFFLCKDVWWYVEWVEEGDSATSRCSQLQPHH